MPARRRLCGVAGVLMWLFSLACSDADSVKGLYVGSDFYAPDESVQNAVRDSGFTRLFLSFFHVDGRGDITYNRTPVVRNGAYVGDPTWGEKLAAAKKQPSGIHRFELTIGGDIGLGGAPEASFSNIVSLVASQGTGPDSILYRDLVALKGATGADAIQLADDRTEDAPAVAAFGKIAAAVGMKVTFCVCTNQDFWAKVKSQLGTNVDAAYLVCYGEGAGNDPGLWTGALDGCAVYPGLWGNSDTPTSAMMKMRHWQRTHGIAGGFMWLNGFLPHDAEKWAGALSCGLDSIATLRIVNKNSGKSLNLGNGCLTNGSALGQSAYETGDNQRWMLVPAGNGDHFKLVSWVSGQCASVAYDSSMGGAAVWTWDYNGDPSQQFDLIYAGNGWFQIKNVRSGLVLEIAGGSITDDAVVQQNIETGAPNQLWKLYPYEPTLLAFENFDYPEGALSGQGGGDGWTGNWLDVVNSGTTVPAGSLSGGTNAPAGYDMRSAGNSAFIPNDRRVGRYLDCSAGGNFGVYGYLDAKGNLGADGKTLYVSFLEEPAKTALFYEFEFNREMERIAGIGNDTHADDVNLRAPPDTFTRIMPGNTNVNFYVLRIDFKPGNDDVRVYCDCASNSEPSEPALTLPDAADMSFNRISLAAFANDNSLKIDEIRIAGSWQYAVAAAPEFEIQSSSNLVADDSFRRVRISARVLGGSMDKYYLLDGDAGVRVLLNRPARLEAGDTVVVAGLIERQGQFVDLIEADATKTGHSDLPQPQRLNHLGSEPQPVWVSLEAILTDLKDSGTERTLGMQMGLERFTARFPSTPKVAASWPIGSRLRLTGVLLRHSGGQAGHEAADSFELLLNSPADVEMLGRPPWWILKRAMIAIGFLAVGLALAFMWIRSLQRQVDRQTRRLMSEITQREQAERARVIEEERSRISRDLHDDLGSILTQINMLADVTAGIKLPPDAMRERVRQISEKSQRMISALDEVVWMMNSRNESLSSLAAYLAAYAEEFLSKTDTICRIEAPAFYPARTVTAEVRNNVFSSVKEAINNAVRHGKAGKVLLKLSAAEDKFEIQIRDDGTGFDPLRVEPGNGLPNLQLRMRKIGGACHVDSSPERGTIVVLQIPIVPSDY